MSKKKLDRIAFPSVFHRKRPCECLRKQTFAGRFTQPSVLYTPSKIWTAVLEQLFAPRYVYIEARFKFAYSCYKLFNLRAKCYSLQIVDKNKTIL